jgi:hypothetical protein
MKAATAGCSHKTNMVGHTAHSHAKSKIFSSTLLGYASILSCH